MSKNKRNPSTETPPRFYPLRDPDDPGKSRLVPVTEEFYQAVYPEIWRKQKKMRKDGFCLCPRRQLWTCDGDCDVCPFYNNTGFVSLDALVANSDGNITIGDTIPDETADIEEALMYAELLDALADELSRLDPDGKKTCELIGEGKSERFIASVLGKARKTYTYQRDGLLASLREALKDYV